MPIVYETTAEMTEEGFLHLDNIPFAKGTRFTVKLIPQDPEAVKVYLHHLHCLRTEFRRRNPFKDMTADEITAELRRQRETMYDE